MARMDTRDTRSDLRERYPSGGTTFTRPMLPPEEATTFNLVRRLAFGHRRRGGVGVVAVHSRALEGGLQGRRPASGADIEIAVEVTPGNWIDLLLQAKRIFESRAGRTGVYEGWSAVQVRNLRRWAARNGDRTPGMLFYNAEIPPFGPPRHEVYLGGCGMSPIRCHGWRWPRWNPPDRRSPIAITLLILPSYPSRLPSSLYGDRLPATAVNQFASPLECIFCPGRLITTVEPCGGRTGSPVSIIKPKNQIPEWAATLLEATGEQAESVDAALTRGTPLPSGDDRWDAQVSVVLPYIQSDPM